MSRVLFEAAGKGDVDRVRALLDQGADFHWRHKQTGRTALTEAAINGRLDVARLLVERGADLNVRDSTVGFTPLGWACDCHHPALVEFFLKAGADPNLASHEFHLTPLMVASGHGNLPAVQLLLQAGADVNAATCDGRRALKIAQTRKQDAVAQALREAGATADSPLPTPERIAWPAVDETGAACDYSRPETVLRSFVFAMNRFETSAAALSKKMRPGADLNKQIIDAAQAVMETYCTASKRPYRRHGSFQTPPEYDPEEEYLIAVNQVGPRRAELITRDEKRGSEYLYVLLKKQGRWLLDSKKTRIVGADWMKWYL